MVSFYSSKLKPSRLEDFIKKKDWEKNVKTKSRKQKKPVKEREKQKVFEIMNTMPLIIQSN